jgi:hypothetical protein
MSRKIEPRRKRDAEDAIRLEAVALRARVRVASQLKDVEHSVDTKYLGTLPYAGELQVAPTDRAWLRHFRPVRQGQLSLSVHPWVQYTRLYYRTL